MIFCNYSVDWSFDGRQPFAEGLSPTVALPLGNSESDSIGQLVFPTGLETDCQRETGASRLAPTQPYGERLPTS
ncbi:MAG: hypothetical protein LBG58_03220 [Planctomycetaceae bacterium]|nr:hypothetical protein [Planctomycetaceae bacterium]